MGEESWHPNQFQDSDEDKISSLPDHVAHHILSFLTMQELAHLFLASKQCREICISIPSLTLNGMRYRDSSQKRSQFINFMERFIVLRNGMETQRISISWPFEVATSDEKCRVLAWLRNTIGCRVELLDLQFMLARAEVFNLPIYVFHCESLKELNVKLHGGCLELPSPSGFSKLQSLSLQHVKIPDENFGEWVSSFCKHLKRLELRNIHALKNISIKSSTLQELVITDWPNLCSISVLAEMLKKFCLGWKFGSYSGKKVEVFAPKLERFGWLGDFVNSYSLGNLKYLRDALVIFRPYPLSRNGVPRNQNLSQLLHSIRSVQGLHLNDECIKVLYKQGCPSTLVFNNLQGLQICTDNLNDDLVPAIASLLQGMHNLRKLSIGSDRIFGKRARSSKRSADSLPSHASGFKRGFWESHNLMFIARLKVVSIELIHKGYNDLEIIKYFLKHAKFLKKMVIFYSPSYSSDLISEIKNYEKASAAKVIFCPMR